MPRPEARQAIQRSEYALDMKVLVTGAAGFIGLHSSLALLKRGDEVIGVDSIGEYYDPALKEARLSILSEWPAFEIIRGDLADSEVLKIAFQRRPSRILHLAAQPGVRYSLKNPRAYIDSNIVGTLNLLEACRVHRAEHFVYASSSSVYGANTSMPYSVHDNVDHPISLYAATKKATELMAHTYSHLYDLPTTGLRFFTVYGPWGRPDMAPSIFTKAIMEGRPIDVFNNGDMERDFTYIDDIVECVLRVLDRIATPREGWSSDSPDPGSSFAPYRLYNIGNSSPIGLLAFIEAIEKATGRKARINLLPMQPGDVRATYADVEDLRRDVGFAPTTVLEDGIDCFVKWYASYYEV
jgi:UDP-glucuronate 4-epimerase